jgi:hypothetical protein
LLGNRFPLQARQVSKHAYLMGAFDGPRPVPAVDLIGGLEQDQELVDVKRAAVTSPFGRKERNRWPER